MTGLFGKMASSARAMSARLSPTRFKNREDGTVTAFAMFMFVLMIGAGGIAIDVMRYETQRAQLQYTLDRAILAAASLTQPYNPEGVVRDYFEISGLTNYRLDIRVEQGLNFRRVHAYAELEIRSLFMQLFGVRLMTSPALGAAEERVNNIEVSMVLDISGSMGSNNRMVNLRPAAREFVTEVLDVNGELASENFVSISIVPYNGRVNGGALIDSVFTFDDVHSYSNCARFTAADYQTTAIDPAAPIPRISHWDRGNEDDDQLFQSPHCQTDQYGAILPWQHDETALHNHINSLGTGGWTAIDLGMNWGVGLLDPAAAPAVQGLIASGDVHADFGLRPAPFVDGDQATQLDDETIKVVVLMTDGANTNQYDLRDIWMTEDNRIVYSPTPNSIYMGFREGNSQVFRHFGADRSSSADDTYSVWWEAQNQFWIPTGDPRDAGGYWSNEPFGGWAAYGMLDLVDNLVVDNWNDVRTNAFDPSVDRDDDGTLDDLDGTVLVWTDLFATYTAEYISEEWYEEPARANGDWRLHNALASASYRYAAQAEADANLRAICDRANEAGIVVFAIGFEAPADGQAVMRHCASTAAHYYDVEGVEISEAFASIARSINQLRLIQ